MNYLDKFSLKNKTAFVNGGGGLIGKEVVKVLADAGAKVILLDINKERAERIKDDLLKEEKKVVFEYFDATELNSIDEKVEKMNKKYGRIDVWVNAAYPKTSDWGKKIEDLSLDSWQKNIDMHLNSYAWISRKVCLMMKEQKGGSLINFGSIYGVVGNDFTVYEKTEINPPPEYAAIKGGIVNFGRFLASYFGKYNVRVNTVCPGGIFDGQDPVFVTNYSQKAPLKRMGKPEEIASAVLFLASDASSYITGATLMVDGGWTAI